MKISGRLTITLLAAALVPLLAAGLWSLYSLQEAERWSLSRQEEANQTAVEESREALMVLGEKMMLQQAEGVARAIELFLAAHPEIDQQDLDSLEQNAELAVIAVQPVGETGYTAVFDEQSITRFHVNPEIVGVPLSNMAGNFPTFWEIFSKTLDGTRGHGYYDWPDADGRIRPKYASIVPVPGTPLRVAATTYIDEFAQPAARVQSQLAARHQAAAQELAQMRRVTMNRLLGILVATALLAGVAAYLFSRRICQPVVAMATAAEQIAEGDLTVTPPPTQLGELGQLAAAFGRITTSLSGLIRQVQSVTMGLSGAAAQVMHTQQQHASDSERQATAVTNASAAVQELASSSATIADTAQQMFATAHETEGNAQRGAAAMAQVTDLLQRIGSGNNEAVAQVAHLSDQAQQIGAIMDLVEDVAAQTRMIAFNASIEAAAGGEVGRRFGIVAGEVRRLAADVAHAGEDIRVRVEEIQATTKALIQASEGESHEIQAGIAAGDSTAQVLYQILQSAELTTLAGHQISLSTQQQRSATEQLLEDLQSLISGARTVAVSSAETVAVMNNLVHTAEELNRTVECFRLPDAVTVEPGVEDNEHAVAFA